MKFSAKFHSFGLRLGIARQRTKRPHGTHFSQLIPRIDIDCLAIASANGDQYQSNTASLELIFP
ncbi:MAG: hypothetical protein LBD60_04170 [Puniceicoccales bacterium]|nr:hypothetical protein [Puniceicoccales bacterium]